LDFGKYKKKKRWVEETVILALLSVQNKCDVAKYIRFVPPFLENEADTDFVHLATIPKSLAWPNGYWTSLLQSILIGNCIRTFWLRGSKKTERIWIGTGVLLTKV
jgi:hypothetical protein